MIYSEARKLVNPQKVLTYENLYAELACGHRVYFWRRNGKSPKKLLCPQCISALMVAAQQTLAPDVAESPQKCTTEKLCPVHNVWHAAPPRK